MLRVLYYRDLLLRQHTTTLKPSFHFNDLLQVGVLHQNQNPLRFISSTNQPSFTVDYLVNKCGLPPQKALSAAKNFRLCSTEKADSVISLLQSYGLTQTHITKLTSRIPKLLSLDPNKKLKPKFEFLKDFGISGPDIANLIASDTTLLSRSLQNHIIPSFNILKNYTVTTADILRVFKRCPRFIEYNLEKTLIPNISILQAHSVPDCNISKFLITQPRTLTLHNDSFKEIVEKAKKMGFNPLGLMFFHAVRTLASMSKSSWEMKLMVYQEFGLVEKDVISAFKKHPHCMKISEEKIRKQLLFFKENIKWKPTDIMLCPNLLLFSLEKRTIPRCVVLRILYSKGIIRKKLSLSTFLYMSERNFLNKTVIKYQEMVPELVNAYKGGIEFTGFGEDVEVKELSMASPCR